MCYVISFKLAMMIFGYILTRGSQSGSSDEKIAVTYEELYPTYVTNAVEHTRFINLLRQEQGSAAR